MSYIFYIIDLNSTSVLTFERSIIGFLEEQFKLGVYSDICRGLENAFSRFGAIRIHSKRNVQKCSGVKNYRFRWRKVSSEIVAKRMPEFWKSRNFRDLHFFQNNSRMGRHGIGFGLRQFGFRSFPDAYRLLNYCFPAMLIWNNTVVYGVSVSS